MLVAGRREGVDGREVHFGLQAFVAGRERAAAEFLGQRRAVLVGQPVAGDVGRGQIEAAAERLFPRGQRLAADAEDQVEIVIVEARLPQDADGGRDVFWLVQSLQEGEFVRVEGLGPHRYPRDAAFPQQASLGRIDRGRIGLDGELLDRIGSRGSSDGVQDGVERVVGHGGGRAAAEEYGADGGPIGRAAVGELRTEGLDHGFEGCSALGDGVEIAVAALGLAERPVEIEAGVGG